MSDKLQNKDLEKVAGGGYAYYITRSGDTLAIISERLHIPQSVLKDLNNIKNPEQIPTGTRIKYPC